MTAKKRRVISAANLPTIPLRLVSGIALWWLFWDRIGIPGWAWGVFWTCVVIYAGLVGLVSWSEETVELDLVLFDEIMKRGSK